MASSEDDDRDIIDVIGDVIDGEIDVCDAVDEVLSWFD